MEKDGLLDDAEHPPWTDMTRTVGWIIGLWGLTACASLPRLDLAKDTLTDSEHVALGHSYLASKETQLAIQQFQAALTQNRKCAPAWMALGTIAFGDQEWDKARSYFRKALKSAPNDPAVINNLAMVDVTEKTHLGRARQLVEDALPAGGALKPYLLDTLARIDLLEGRYDDARRALDQAAAAAPANDPEFSKNLQRSRDLLAEAISKNGDR